MFVLLTIKKRDLYPLYASRPAQYCSEHFQRKTNVVASNWQRPTVVMTGISFIHTLWYGARIRNNGLCKTSSQLNTLETGSPCLHSWTSFPGLGYSTDRASLTSIRFSWINNTNNQHVYRQNVTYVYWSRFQTVRSRDINWLTAYSQ
jgi:hypothetical protein